MRQQEACLRPACLRRGLLKTSCAKLLQKHSRSNLSGHLNTLLCCAVRQYVIVKAFYEPGTTMPGSDITVADSYSIYAYGQTHTHGTLHIGFTHSVDGGCAVLCCYAFQPLCYGIKVCGNPCAGNFLRLYFFKAVLVNPFTLSCPFDVQVA